MSNGLAGFAFGLSSGINSGIRLADKMDEWDLQKALKKAGDVNPEKTEEVGDYTKTMGLTKADDQARMLQEQDAAFGADGARSTAEALNSNSSDTTPAADMVKTTHRMGGKTQDTPFTQEQIDSQRFRNQADVYSGFGKADKAATLQGLAKTREEEGVTSQIRAGAMEGLKNTKDMKDEEKIFSISKGMYEQALKLNRPDLASGYYNQMTQNRDALLNRANDRADRVYRATGNISGYVDSYNRYVADGMTIDAFKRNEDGSHVFTMNDGTGKTRDISVPKEKSQEYLMALRDPKRMAELEAKRAEILFKSQSDAQEALNKPVAVGKDQTLVIPGTGQTFAPGANRKFDPKDQQAVGDDIRNHAMQIHGVFDQTSGKFTWTPKAIQVADTMESLYSNGHGLPVTQLRKIAEEGKPGQAKVTVNGKPTAVNGVAFGGNLYLLDGSGTVIPMSGQKANTEKELSVREALSKTGPSTPVSGKISPRPSPGLTPIAPQSKASPADFPRVSPEQQAQRDALAGQLAVEERSVDAARRDLAEIDAALKSKRLEGTQRQILQSERNRIASGLAAAA